MFIQSCAVRAGIVAAASLLALCPSGARAQLTFTDISQGPNSHIPTAISADGSVVVGSRFSASDRSHPFRWTAQQGLIDLGTLYPGRGSTATAVSADGSVVVGCGYADQYYTQCEFFRWTAADGMVNIGATLPDYITTPTAISGDGETVVGIRALKPNGTNPGTFVWHASRGWSDLGAPPGMVAAIARGINADGSAMCGDARAGNLTRAWRWTRTGGFEELAPLVPNGQANASAITPDGRVCVGSATGVDGWKHVVRWSPEGLRDLGRVVDMAGAVAMNSDGSLVVGAITWAGGHGFNPARAVIWTEYEGRWSLLQDFLASRGIPASSGRALNHAYAVSADGSAIAGDFWEMGPFDQHAYLIRGLPWRPCPADLDDGSATGTRDQGVTIDDLLYFLACYEAGDAGADLDDGSGAGTRDGHVTAEDLTYFLGKFERGC